MRELSLHILDIVQNSIGAGAKTVRIAVNADTARDTLTITIADDGKGMSKEFAANVTDPFTTTRTTRKVGMGLALFKAAAEDTGGSLKIESEQGKGTTVTAAFGLTSIDRVPLGDLAGTLLTLVRGAPDVDYVLTCGSGSELAAADTRKIKKELDGVPIDTPEILIWLEEYIKELLETHGLLGL
ncbi:histidine kinase [Clostridia bacterium]|nr:histidine kinase [Clostridia bacterium]